MAAALCKINVGKPGLGAAHASYITRLSALDPDRKDRQERDAPDRRGRLALLPLGHDEDDPEADQGTDLDRDLSEWSFSEVAGGTLPAERDEDPIWTWNAARFITGDDYGIGRTDKKPSKEIQEHERMLTEKMAARTGPPGGPLTLKQKIDNARTYFGSK